MEMVYMVELTEDQWREIKERIDTGNFETGTMMRDIGEMKGDIKVLVSSMTNEVRPQISNLHMRLDTQDKEINKVQKGMGIIFERIASDRKMLYAIIGITVLSALTLVAHLGQNFIHL